MMTPILYQSMYGLGDNIFIRPFIRAQSAQRRVFLQTCWPELFEDLDVTLIAPRPTNLRTQQKNIVAQRRAFAPEPKGIRAVKIGYGDLQLRASGSITRALEAQLPPNGQPLVWDLPAKMLAGARQKYAIIRPATLRKEWHNPARSPLPEYINRVAAALMNTHTVMVVADLLEDHEWLEGPMPPHHQAFTKGELSVFTLLNLVARADIIVGGVGWIVPAAVATGTPAFIILGGQAIHNGPSVITDPRMNLSRIAFAKPDHYCQCSNMRHQCNKTISNLPAQWSAFASSGTTLCSSLSALDG